MAEKTLKMQVGEYLYPVKVDERGSRLYLSFPYNKKIMSEIKAMRGAKWHGFDEENPRKIWSIENCGRNWFQLDFLCGKNPYERYDKVAPTLLPRTRFNLEKNCELPVGTHQLDMLSNMLTYRQMIIAAEMGTGKSLAAILCMEESGITDWWVIATRSGVLAFNRELTIWQAKVRPSRVMTYEALVKLLAEWPPGLPAPKGIIVDESQRVKNPGAKRSQAVDHLAESMRREHGADNIMVIEMSGSPAPKSPADWWNQCEIACPGFIREGTVDKFKQRLAIIINKENIITGGSYPQLLAWRDDERRCNICGQFKDHLNHDPQKQLMSTDGEPHHDWQPSINEVAHLYQRMKGLVFVKFKKDCLSLPEKQYRVIRLEPSAETLRAAELISESAPTAIQALTLLRELSDGFQYQKKLTRKEKCEVCDGAKIRKQQAEVPGSCPNCPSEGECLNHQPQYEERDAPCDGCKGTGERPVYERTTVEVPCPKEEYLKNLLEEHEDVGRLVVFAGFEGAVDRVTRICRQEGWHVIRVDGRGWKVFDPDGKEVIVDPLTMFQQMQEQYEKVVYVAHPGSGGTAVTLTASPTELYYSNDFNGENRIQSEDRIHRMGMDVNRGATIIDLIHLSTDEKILENVKRKRDLQSMTLGEVKNALSQASKERVL